MVNIEHDIPIPAVRERKVPERVQNAMDRYSQAYRRVYGVPAEIEYSEPWFKIHGVTHRVELLRLKEMTNQLNYRAG